MKLAAEKRNGGKAAALRRQGRIPGIVYNRELNLAVSMETKAFDRVFRSQGSSSVIDLEVDGENHEVLVKTVQMDKRRRIPMHVDFYAITAGQEVEVYVHVEFTGKAAGTKEGGELAVQRREVHIRVLPRLIPNHIDVDISHLNIGDAIHIGDVKHLLPQEATILDEDDLTLISVQPPRLLVDEEEPSDEDLEPEVIGEEADEEGDGDESDESDADKE